MAEGTQRGLGIIPHSIFPPPLFIHTYWLVSSSFTDSQKGKRRKTTWQRGRILEWDSGHNVAHGRPLTCFMHRTWPGYAQKVLCSWTNERLAKEGCWSTDGGRYGNKGQLELRVFRGSGVCALFNFFSSFMHPSQHSKKEWFNLADSQLILPLFARKQADSPSLLKSRQWNKTKTTTSPPFSLKKLPIFSLGQKFPCFFSLLYCLPPSQPSSASFPSQNCQPKKEPLPRPFCGHL